MKRINQLIAGLSEGKMTGYESKHRSAQEIEIAELRNSLAMAQQKKTLRDEFAMAAVNGVINRFGVFPAKFIAEESYELADAMMKERVK